MVNFKVKIKHPAKNASMIRKIFKLNIKINWLIILELLDSNFFSPEVERG